MIEIAQAIQNPAYSFAAVFEALPQTVGLYFLLSVYFSIQFL